MPGPPKKPTILKLVQGNPGHRPLAQNEPIPLPGDPYIPDWLSPKARTRWPQIAKSVRVLGVTATIDGDGLAFYCEALADYLELRDRPSKSMTYLQAFRARIDARKQLLSLLVQYGLTPAARTRVAKLEAPKEDDELEGLLKRKRKPDEKS